MLEDVADRLEMRIAGLTDEAQKLYDALSREAAAMLPPMRNREGNCYVESAYSVMRGMTGTPLRDSFISGQRSSTNMTAIFKRL